MAPTDDITNLVRYDVSEGQIAELAEQFSAVTFDTPAAYEVGRKAIATVRELRVAVEKRRKDLKADSLEFGRRVDSVASHFKGLLEAIEDPLVAKRDAVDAEKERIKREAEERKRAEIEAAVRVERAAKEAEERAAREAQEAIDRAARAAEDERLRVERVRLDAERAELEERQRLADEAARVESERLRVVREAIESERREIDAQRAKADREDFERQARAQAEAEAAAKLQRDQVLAEAARAREEAEQKRREAMRPDVEKVMAFALSIRGLMSPPVLCESEAAAGALAVAADDLLSIAASLEAFARAHGAKAAA